VASAGEAAVGGGSVRGGGPRRTAQVADRARWLGSFFATGRLAESMGRSQLAERALWQSDSLTAITEAEAAIRAAQA
jgi:hypothetical protein